MRPLAHSFLFCCPLRTGGIAIAVAHMLTAGILLSIDGDYADDFDARFEQERRAGCVDGTTTEYNLEKIFLSLDMLIQVSGFGFAISLFFGALKELLPAEPASSRARVGRLRTPGVRTVRIKDGGTVHLKLAQQLRSLSIHIGSRHSDRVVLRGGHAEAAPRAARGAGRPPRSCSAPERRPSPSPPPRGRPRAARPRQPLRQGGAGAALRAHLIPPARPRGRLPDGRRRARHHLPAAAPAATAPGHAPASTAPAGGARVHVSRSPKAAAVDIVRIRLSID